MKSYQSGFAHIVIILVAASLVGGAGTAIASNSARPGDFLYGIDKSIESVQSSLTFGETAKANMYVNRAQERMGEYNSLVNGNASEENLDKALRNYGDVVDEAFEKANKLDDNDKQEVLSAIARESLVNQENLLELAVESPQIQMHVENAFKETNQNYEQAYSNISEQNQQKVMNEARNQVRNLDGLLEQIQLKNQEQVQQKENTPNSENSQQSDNSKQDENKSEESGSSGNQPANSNGQGQ